MTATATAPARRVSMLLSPRALPYADRAIRSLLAHSLDPLDFALLTDSAEDKAHLLRLAGGWAHPRHTIAVHSDEELTALAEVQFAAYPHLRALRAGHPCWRKITDPLLLAAAGEEMVVLDPDLYFPRAFRFEPTPDRGVLLMWQRPSCLLPYRPVDRAFAARIPLARQVDIGVAQWRGGDLAWLDQVIDTLGAARNPGFMHIEAVLWAAIAMHEGGHHLDPRFWVCWRNTPLKRLARLLKLDSDRMLHLEPLHRAKCFHAGGPAKHWLAKAAWLPPLADSAVVVEGPATTNTGAQHLPYRPLEEPAYRRERTWKRILLPFAQRSLLGE